VGKSRGAVSNQWVSETISDTSGHHSSSFVAIDDTCDFLLVFVSDVGSSVVDLKAVKEEKRRGLSLQLFLLRFYRHYLLG